jgi:hypothetical protein
MNKKLESVNEEEFNKKIFDYIYNNLFQWSICYTISEDPRLLEDPSTLTGQAIIEKTRAFYAQNPKDVNIPIFLKYLSIFPVSMCSWEVTPLLRMIIGFHYRAGIPNEEEKNKGAEAPSYEDLAQIFVRSKSTIADCINKTETLYLQMLKDTEQEDAIMAEAQKQLIAEKKETLKAKGTEEATPNERTDN